MLHFFNLLLFKPKLYNHEVIFQDGMGMRYAFMGPMETIHLNAEGTQNYCDRYGEVSYKNSIEEDQYLCCLHIPNKPFTITITKST